MPDTSLKGLTFKYIFALSLIACLLLVSFFLINHQIKNNEISAAVINISGRQRMFSQRIGMISLQLVQEEDSEKRDELRVLLSQNISSMEVITRSLASR